MALITTIRKKYPSSNYRPEEAIEYYIEKIENYNFNPLYYFDFGSYFDDESQVSIKLRKARYVNLITKLKQEIRKIKVEWSKHYHLKNKSLGEVIYGTGRNAAAHGGGGYRNTARYDYSLNYQHINNVNIFLELIARYIIETMNPTLKNRVERRIKQYEMHSQYKVMLERERGETVQNGI